MSKIVGCYAVPDTSTNIYPEWVHDHNISVLNEGKQNWFLHLERFTRKKYHAGMPEHLESIVKELKLLPANDTVFVFVDHEIGRSFISKSGKIRFEAPMVDAIAEGLEPAKLYWFGEWPESYVLNHELAHIYSCVPFYGNFHENSLLVHFDGGASLSNFSAWHYRNGKPRLIEAHYNHKWLSSLFNANALVFSIINAKKKEQNSVPGKFMGLEAFGKFRHDIETWLQENNFFENIWGKKAEFFKSAKKNFNINLSDFNTKNPFIEDIAATIHEIFLRESLKIFIDLQERTNTKYLYYSGGTALNIKLNAKIIDKGIFNEVFIPPCTNDSGLSIGATAAVSLKMGIEPKTLPPYLNNFGINDSSNYIIKKDIVDELAMLVKEGKVIGICNGFGEVGPRALGNRSIVARADNKSISQKISQEMKKREWFRPVAPIMLEENAKYFTGKNHLPIVSKYMLTEFEILPEKKSELLGCIHIDNTSRVQVIFERKDNPFMYDLLQVLYAEYGIKALINTSFNQSGEPIVQSEEDARRSAKAMNLDALVINGDLFLPGEY